jgi:hypothetical protein
MPVSLLWDNYGWLFIAIPRFSSMGPKEGIQITNRYVIAVIKRLILHKILNQLGTWNLSPPKVFGTTFYMGKFNGPTPKRHRLFSNDRDFLQPIADAAGYMSRVEQSQCKVKTARSYHDKQGVRRHVGNKETLRDSQKLCFNPTICFYFPETTQQLSKLVFI